MRAQTSRSSSSRSEQRSADYVLPASSQYEKAKSLRIEHPNNHITLPFAAGADRRHTARERDPPVSPTGDEVYSDAQIEPLLEAAREPRRSPRRLQRRRWKTRSSQASVPSSSTRRSVRPSTNRGDLVQHRVGRAGPSRCGRQDMPVKCRSRLGIVDAFLTSRDGIVFTSHDHSDAFGLLKTPDQKIIHS